MWDPWSGRIVQFYGAEESARALEHPPGGVETNRMGSRCIQVEAWFSPGCVVNGKTYATLADTPCKGLEDIVAWMRTLGIPDVWPSGRPQWSGNSRSAATWRGKAGHYGHCHVPGNSHGDPGPMPSGMFAGGWQEAMMGKLPTLGKGDTGEHVESVQGLLLARSHPEVHVNGHFDDVTETAVKAVQKWGGVAADGIVGPDTWPVLLRVK
ncbi:peptidoglycan-binding protein [Actinomadura sp. LCR2-06]|uniref:Peptidoglycan-binding protein n=2 Tax=Actinomadura violacea TaxID=2819934 RepID=A0ABS3RXT6_9ACTN|nr:peptidoglycan-binding protein [Actinomadura violacea]